VPHHHPDNRARALDRAERRAAYMPRRDLYPFILRNMALTGSVMSLALLLPGAGEGGTLQIVCLRPALAVSENRRDRRGSAERRHG
jgi:hypothetical protein